MNKEVVKEEVVKEEVVKRESCSKCGGTDGWKKGHGRQRSLSSLFAFRKRDLRGFFAWCSSPQRCFGRQGVSWCWRQTLNSIFMKPWFIPKWP